MLSFTVRINLHIIGDVNVRRLTNVDLDISDPEAIADVVSEYSVTVDGGYLGTVRHRYGDGAYRLVAIASDFVAWKRPH